MLVLQLRAVSIGGKNLRVPPMFSTVARCEESRRTDRITESFEDSNVRNKRDSRGWLRKNILEDHLVDMMAACQPQQGLRPSSCFNPMPSPCTNGQCSKPCVETEGDDLVPDRPASSPSFKTTAFHVSASQIRACRGPKK
ncbi:hypothetical protein GWK47_028114 [Chionoecetes opilio]|uniref:Uncharacterized protein n=1 Tax=Chionoecetes opilio TaxID=41210 RepID=A0A8J4YXQ2_CHIOP|nr:hypothetical protein GWK47_028114 [Chionoecetes opilio]